MAIKNNRIFGIAVPLSLADVPDRKLALENLDLNIEDLEIIRGISSPSETPSDGEEVDEGSVFDSNDLQTISNLTSPVWRTFDRYINDVTTYQGSLSDSGGVDFQLRGNLEVAGGINSTAYRYTLLDTTDGTPRLKWGDISTSRVSSWSTIGDTIIYGADVEIGGTLKVGKIKTRTVARKKTFDSEVPTHRIKIDLNGQTRYIYAMKGIPLRFKGYFRNFRGVVDYNQVLGRKVSWRLYRTDGIGGNEDFENLGSNTQSILDYRSPFSAERYIEVYYSPDAITRLEVVDTNIQEIPRVKLNSLKRFDFYNNGIVDFPDVNFFAPNLEYFNINNNPFYNGSDSNYTKLNQNVIDRLPSSLKTLFLRGNFYGGIQQSTVGSLMFAKFQNLEYLNITRSGGPYFYPDSINPNGELPNFYGTSDGSTHKLREFYAASNDFRSVGVSSGNSKSISELESLERLDLYNNFNLVNTNFSLVSQKLVYLRINSTGLSGPTLANISTLQTFDAPYTRNFGSFYTGWNGVLGSPNQPSSNATYKYANCTGLNYMSLYASGVAGYIPKFVGNSKLEVLDLRVCNNLIAGRPGETEVKCLYDDTFEQARVIREFYLSVNNPNFAGPVGRNTFAPTQDTLQVLHIFAAGRFTGDFPDLEKCNKLTDIRSAGEGWTGPLPNFSSSFNINRIDLYNNKFIGSVQYSGKNSLDYINVSGNDLTSISPNFSAPNLRYFYVSSNEFTGNLPILDGQIPKAEFIALNNNQFDNYIGGFKGLKKLKQLDLSANILSKSAVDSILFDLVDNYKSAPRRGVTVNLLGSNAAPTPFPIIFGIVNGLTPASQPTVQNGLITNLGGVGNVASGYFPVSKTYTNVGLNYEGTAADGQGLSATVKVTVNASENVVKTISSTFSAPGNTGGKYTNGGAFTDNGTKSSGTGAKILVNVETNNQSASFGQVTSCTLIEGGSGYKLTDIIVIPGSSLGSPGDDVQIPITQITPIIYSSVSYSVTAINSGGTNYKNGETLKTNDVIEFKNSDGDIDYGYIKINVSSVTQRTDTTAYTGFAAVEFLRNVGWVVQVNN
jgi:Leucine-rich repeat (LRR) protein